MKILQQGAEAIIYQNNNQVIKDRIPKSYRLKILDEAIRKRRTKKEKKLLEKVSTLIPAPEPEKDSEKFKITMPFIKGKKLSEHLDNLKNANQICKKVGEQTAIIHDNHIIHGDLTTSNMILSSNELLNRVGERFHLSKNNNNKSEIERLGGKNAKATRENNKLYFIDFGLGKQTEKPEDKAVDLHLIKQALEARHFKNYESFWKSFLQGYKKSKNAKQVLERLEKVEARGRYKGKH